MQLTVKKILVPIAFTDNCLRAKDFADSIAAKFGAEVELLHVVEASPYEVYQQRGIVADVPIYESALGSVPRSTQKFIVKDVMEETRNELDKIAATNGAGVKYKTEVKHGHSVDEILRVIDEYKPDLVVMATHGRTGVRHMLLGSVAERIVRLSPVPVLTVRAAE
jgi:nucleotide-binding universal stress UspA family protein